MREMAIMKRLDHPNIVRLYEIINDSDHERLYMGMKNVIYNVFLVFTSFVVLEYMAGGPICKNGEIVEEETARRYFADIITGIDYCKWVYIYTNDLTLHTQYTRRKSFIET